MSVTVFAIGNAAEPHERRAYCSSRGQWPRTFRLRCPARAEWPASRRSSRALPRIDRGDTCTRVCASPMRKARHALPRLGTQRAKATVRRTEIHTAPHIQAQQIPTLTWRCRRTIASRTRRRPQPDAGALLPVASRRDAVAANQSGVSRQTRRGIAGWRGPRPAIRRKTGSFDPVSASRTSRRNFARSTP